MRKVQRAVFRLVPVILALLAACPNPISSGKGSALTISINNNINARTLLPAIDMNAASFTVSGTGPGTATFSQTTSGAPVTLDGLAFGAWSVTVNALNSAGTLVGSGQATVTVHTGQTSTVTITVVPLMGNGSLNLTVTWTASQLENASILASLTPPVGPSTPLSFSVTGSQATYSSTTIPAGYQTLTVQLLDGVMPVMGAVEVVRIVAGQMTSGTYAFTNVNQPGGTVQVNITPAMAEPIPVSISGVPATIVVGGSMTATASVGDGTANVAYVWYLNGVSAGMGAAYTLPSTVTAGYYRLDVTVYAADGTRAGSATANLKVAKETGRFLYVTNSNGDTISAYAIGAGGLLTPLGTPTLVPGSRPVGIATTPAGSFLYVANSIISTYAIDPRGLLTPLGASIFAGMYPFKIAVTPNGSFLYVTSGGSNDISGYAIGSGGQLTQLSIPTFATGADPYGIAVTPNGSFLYVTNRSSNTISSYAIGSGGLLPSLGAPTFAPGGPCEIAMTPNGSFLYTANYVGNSVSAFAIGSGGLLTPLSTPTLPAQQAPCGIAVTPNGSFLYVSNLGSSAVSGYAIGSDGQLTPLSTPAFNTGTNPIGIAITPDGSFLYVANGGRNIVSAYTIGSDGLLTPLSTPTFPAGEFPYDIVVVP